MKLRKDREKFLTVRTAYIWSALVGVVGLLLVVLFNGESETLPRALSLLGQAFFSAGVIAVTFGWISSEENEVLSNDSIFGVDNVRLDGRVLDQSRPVHGGNISERIYEVPRHRHGQEVRISFMVSVRKFFGSESRIPIITKIFSDVTRAEYMLSVGSSVGATHIHYSCDGVTTWTGGLVDHESEEVTDPSGQPVSRSIRLLEPIQRESQISFVIERS